VCVDDEEVNGVGTYVEHTEPHAVRLLLRCDTPVTEPVTNIDRTVETSDDAPVVHMPTPVVHRWPG
jgi:hypothetical protein